MTRRNDPAKTAANTNKESTYATFSCHSGSLRESTFVTVILQEVTPPIKNPEASQRVNDQAED